MSTHIENEKPAETVAKRVLHLADRLDPQDGHRSPHESHQEIIHDVAIISAQTARMIAPIYVAFHNGGLPSKRAGKKTRFFGFDVPAEQLATVLTRVILIGGIVTIIAMLHGAKVQIDGHGMTISPKVAEAGR